MKKTIFIIFSTLVILSKWTSASEDANMPEPHSIEFKDIMEWKSFRSATLSSDGQWFGYRIVPNEGNSSVVIKNVGETEEYRFPNKDKEDGKAKEEEDKDKSYTSFRFSDDSKWAVVIVSPDWQEQKKLRKDKKPIHDDAVVLNLTDGTRKEFKNIQDHVFPKESSTWLALKKYPPESKAEEDEENYPKGSDVLLWELGTENRLTISKASEYAFNKSGEWFAWIVSSEDKESNSVQMRNMTTGVVLPIEHGEFVYKSLNWNEEGDGLAFLKGKEDEDYEEPFYSVIGLKGFDQESPSKHMYDPNEDKSFPDEMTVSPHRNPVWTDDLTAISFGIHETELT